MIHARMHSGRYCHQRYVDIPGTWPLIFSDTQHTSHAEKRCYLAYRHRGLPYDMSEAMVTRAQWVARGCHRNSDGGNMAVQLPSRSYCGTWPVSHEELGQSDVDEVDTVDVGERVSGSDA